jgi:modulator of FtsH protease
MFQVGDAAPNHRGSPSITIPPDEIPMPIDAMQGWSSFFAGQLGAAAALTGLLFVAVSINLARILQFSHLPTRAAETLLALVSVLVVCTFALIPRQSAQAYGFEIGATGLIFWALSTRSLIRSRKFDRQYVRFTTRFVLTQLPALPFVIAGALLIAGRFSGVYWIVPGILLSFAAGIFGAWVLLVEIQR